MNNCQALKRSDGKIVNSLSQHNRHCVKKYWRQLNSPGCFSLFVTEIKRAAIARESICVIAHVLLSRGQQKVIADCLFDRVSKSKTLTLLNNYGCRQRVGTHTDSMHTQTRWQQLSKVHLSAQNLT